MEMGQHVRGQGDAVSWWYLFLVFCFSLFVGIVQDSQRWASKKKIKKEVKEGKEEEKEKRRRRKEGEQEKNGRIERERASG